MAVEFQITGAGLLEALKARAITARPCVSNSMEFQGDEYHVAWFEIGDGQLQIAADSQSYTLNTLVEDEVKVPENGGFDVTLNRLQVSQPVTVHLCTRDAMKQSNNNQAPTIPVQLQLTIDLIMDVTEDGVARLWTWPVDVEVQGVQLSSEEQEALNAFVLPRLRTGARISLRALARFPGAEVPRVINAGIAARPDLSAVALRFELETPTAASVSAWQDFFTGQFLDLMYDEDWGMLIPREIIEPAAQVVLGGKLASNPDFNLETAIDVTWSPLGSIPRMFVCFTGEVIDGCLDIDMSVDVTIDVRFTVPQPNTLRNTVIVGYDTYFFEEVGCVLGTAFLFPIVGALMIDSGKIEWGEYVAGFTLGPLAVLIASVVVMEGDAAASQIPGPPNYVKDSDVQWHSDMSFPSSFGGISGMNMTLAAGIDAGLVLAGSLNLPAITVPTLKTFPHGFEWRLADPCRSMVDHEAEASIGIVADPMGATPRNPLRICDVRVINDPEGRYSETRIPADGGIMSSASFSVRVRSSPGDFVEPGESLQNGVEDPPVIGEAEDQELTPGSPDDLEVLIFSNQGCRLITIPPPPPLPALPSDPQERQQLEMMWETWKLTHCVKFASIWDDLHMANPEWVIDPPPEQFWAQHWWIEASGNDPGDVITLLDGLGRELMSAVADSNGRAEVTALIEEHAARDSVWLSRNGTRLSPAEFRSRSAEVPTPESPPARQLVVKQVLLRPASEIVLEEAATDVMADFHRGQPTVFVRVGAGLRAFGLADAERPESLEVDLKEAARVEARHATLTRVGRVRKASIERADRCSGRVLDLSDPDSPCEVASYRARPWYVGGARLGRLYARLDDTGTRIQIYRMGESNIGLECPPLREEVFRGPEDDPEGRGVTAPAK